MGNERVLYSNRELRIIYASQQDKPYVLMIGKDSISLIRSEFDKLSRTLPEGLREKLNTINHDSDNILRQGALSYKRLSWAITQVRFMELSEELELPFRLRPR